MKYLILITILFPFFFSGNQPNEPEDCHCQINQEVQLDAYQKGDLKTFLKQKNETRLRLIKDRLTIMTRYAADPKVAKSQKAQVNASVQELQKVYGYHKQLAAKIRSAKVIGKKELMPMLHQIQGRSREILNKSSKIIFGAYHADEVPPVIVIRPGGGGTNCEEGESPPAHDCAGVSQGVNRACMDGIQQKMECGYYTDMGNDGQNQLNQDLTECTTAMENSRASCQQAVENCDNNYDPNGDMYDFWRRASFHCSLKDMLNEPAQTQTNTGN